MDIQLPGMDGLEITKRLKEQPATADIPVIAVTSYAMKGDREKALAAGCAGYVTKPIDKTIFIQEIAARLGAKPKLEDPR
jgi:CheY-like chemotaxis protein